MWAEPRESRFKLIKAVVESSLSDVLCLTEGRNDILPQGGYALGSQSDYGYLVSDPLRRKVLLWSRQLWSNVDDFGSPSFPGGRFVSGVTETGIGPVRMIGVCIPWKSAHVSTGQRHRKTWEDHQNYLDALNVYLRAQSFDIPTLVAGDFNQRIPRRSQPHAVYDKLMSVFEQWTIPTTGTIAGKQLIDHVAMRGDLCVSAIDVINRESATGQKLTDHDGAVLTLHSGQRQS
jgi:hypothetical protein